MINLLSFLPTFSGLAILILYKIHVLEDDNGYIREYPKETRVEEWSINGLIFYLISDACIRMDWIKILG